MENVYFNIENSYDTHTISPIMNSLTLDSLLQKLPYLKYLIDTHGDMSLFDYARSYYKVSPDENTLFIERKKEFLEILGKYVS